MDQPKGKEVDRLNWWVALIANLGVIAGIVFLAYEIRINTNAVSTSSNTSYISYWTEMNTSVAQDAELVEIMFAAGTGGLESLRPDQLVRLLSLSSTICSWCLRMC